MSSDKNKKNNIRKINILFATPECTPFAHTGGLGEVAGSLPRALNRKKRSDIDCRVILPLYSCIGQEYRDKMKFLGTANVQITWRNEYMGLFELKQNQVTYYFIDNEYYFKRDGLYGYYDDGERFAYFSRALFEAIPLMDFVPDIIHANDWQTALVPVFQNSVYRREYTKTVFTVHNIEYQGHYGHEFLSDVLGLPEDQNHIVEFGEDVNLMKGGIESANLFTTVSPTYAEELKDPAYAFGMQDIVNRNAFKLRGILNGIDKAAYDPKKDRDIAANYSSKDLRGKKECKKALQEELALPVKDVPLITMVSRLVTAKGLDLVRDVIDGVIDNNDVQFVILGTGYPEYEDFFRGLEERHRDKVRSMIEFDTALSHRIYSAGDILLVPSRSEPCGLTQMIGCTYGDIPVVRNTGGLADSITDCTLGDGNGFVFDNYDADSLYHALMNAVSRYGDNENWTKLVKHDLGLDFSWAASAEKYRRMYESLYE